MIPSSACPPGQADPAPSESRPSHQLHHASGLFFALLGLALYGLIIPRHTEFVDYGWVRPETVPNVAALVLLAAGAKLTLAPEGSVEPIGMQALRAALLLGLAGLAVFLMGRFGFVSVAPAFALAMMLLIGERRPVWLLAGVVAVPFSIWFAATTLLDRPLP